MPTIDEKILNEMLDYVLSLPQQKRTLYLKQLCEENPPLGNKIKELVAYCEVDVPDDFLQPSAISAEMIRQVYSKLKQEKGKDTKN